MALSHAISPTTLQLMPSAKKKSSKPTHCPACGGVDLIRKITTYPVLLSGPLEGKQVHVGRVALHECSTCGHLMPTPAGQAKVDCNVEMGIRLFLDNSTDRLHPLCHRLHVLTKLTCGETRTKK